MIEHYISWDEFKNNIAHKEDSFRWIYRGHGSEIWKLQSTLFRFLNVNNDVKEKFLAKEYFAKLQDILSDRRIDQDQKFRALSLPEKNPFLLGLMCADKEHYEYFNNTFRFMIELRHLGFPSPLLDWSKNPKIAAFFAFSGTGNDDCASILRLKVKSIPKPLGFYIHASDFNFSLESTRHREQEAYYTLAVEQQHTDMGIGPSFHIGSYDELENPNVEIEKYIICDSKNNKIAFLNELYNEGLSFEKLYGDAHHLEYSVLKDLAIKKFLLQNT